MRYVMRVLVSTISFVFLMGCQAKSTLSLPNPSASFVVSTSEYPSVVKVILPGGSGLCTGTFVSPRAVLTAAHCLSASGSYTVSASFGVFQTSSFEKLGPGTVDDPNDIGILWFASDVADASKGQVASIGNSVRSGDTLRLIGFGCNNLDTRLGSGTKRTGTNVVADVNDYVEFLTPITSNSGTSRGILGPTNRAASCFGDSGGPAAEVLADGSLSLKAVTHAGGTSGGMILSQYVDMSRSDNRAFVARVNSDRGLAIAGF